MQQLYDMIPSQYKVHVYLPQHKMLCLELFSVQLNLKKKKHFMHSKGKHPERGHINLF